MIRALKWGGGEEREKVKRGGIFDIIIKYKLTTGSEFGLVLPLSSFCCIALTLWSTRPFIIGEASGDVGEVFEINKSLVVYILVIEFRYAFI